MTDYFFSTRNQKQLKAVLLCILVCIGNCVSSFFSSQAFACASCGSGGDDPLILYPNQEWRFYLGVSRASGFKTIKSNGRLGDENAPTFKDAATLAIGKAMSPYAFMTLTIPYLQNWKNGTYRRSVGDPILASRWTVLPTDLSEPWIPQLQIMGSYRFSQAKPQQESTNPDRLDAFGQGVPETKLGLDVFHGMTNFKVGAAQSFLFPGERNLGGQSQYMGLGSRSVVTLGYGLSGLGKVQVGYTRETRANSKTNGKEVPNSKVIDNGIFLTCDAEISDMEMLRVSFVKKTPFWDSRNGSRNNAVSVAWMWGLAP